VSLLAVPRLKPQFLKDLLEVLGKPSSVIFIVSGKEISEAAMKIGEAKGLRLEEYVAGSPTQFRGEVSNERILKIYTEWLRYVERQMKPRKVFNRAERQEPNLAIKEICWYGEDYSIKFDEWGLEVNATADNDDMIGRIVQCAKGHDIRITMNLARKAF